MTFAEIFLTSAVTSGSIAGVIVALARTWMSERIEQSIRSEYATRLELHKAQFKAEFDIKVSEYQAAIGLENSQVLERFKADIQVAAAQRQLLQKNMHEREADAIAEVYEILSEVLPAVRLYVSIMEHPAMGTKADRRAELQTALVKFRTRFRARRLYLPRGLADSVDGFVKELSRRAVTFASRVEPDERTLDASEIWMKIDEYMDTEAPALFDRLEAEFRRRLGQEDSTDSAGAIPSGEPAQQAAGVRQEKPG